MSSNKRNAVQHKRKNRKGIVNIGTFLFSAVLIYLIISIVSYMTKNHVSPYEITEGSIVEDSVYTGVIVRSEKEVKSEQDGYINYYLDDVSKAGAGQHVCAVSKKTLIDLEDTGDNNTKKLSSAQESVMLSGIQQYVTAYTSDNYARLYDLHNEIDAAYGVNSADYLADQIDSLAEKGEDIKYVDAPADGLIVYTVDSLDGLTAKDVTTELFEKKKYNEQVNRQNTKIKKNERLFRMITDEKWSILFPLNQEASEKMHDTKMIETRIGNMQSTIWGDFEIVNQNGDTFGKLTFSTDMLQFASQRFVTVELVLQNDSGLKIPESAVVERSVYEIPSDFVITDPNTGSTAVMLKDESGETIQKQIQIFTKLEKQVESASDQQPKTYYYVKKNELTNDTVIYRDNGPGTYTVNKTVKMKGVYNINKGYASFQYIDIKASNDLYYIVGHNTEYGPSTYDHIALNADKLKENVVVH